MPLRIKITRDLLNKFYWDKDLSIYQIAPILKYHPATVAKKLHEFNITIKTPTERTILSKNNLKDLYLKEGLSTNQVAKQLKCSVKTVRRGMRIYNISLRPLKRITIEKKILETLYYKSNLSLQTIGKRYNLTPSGVLRKMRKYNIRLKTSWENNTIHPKIPFNGSSEEKAYLIGFRLGDLGVKQKSKRTGSIVVKSNTTKLEQVTLMKNLFSCYSAVWISGPNIKGVFHFTTLLHPSFDFLIPKNDCIPDWIKNTKKLFLAFIAGYTDAEGNIGVYGGRARFRIGSYDIGILRSINDFFAKLGLRTILRLEQPKGFIDKRGVIHNGDFWRVCINEKNSLLKIFDLLIVYMKHQKRIADLLKARVNILQRNHAIIQA
ncbi:hypothetical protein HYS92_00855 [Candidatus Daviesbacteria bacterium]|nr:hypothetical protein [Candidatus Daviesbacteria bacterium]